VKKTIAEYLKMDAKVPSDNCPTCAKSKMVYSKQSQVHERRSSKPIEKLHIYGGEFHVKSLSGNFYKFIMLLFGMITQITLGSAVKTPWRSS
jgi:hypothetical protein